MTDILELPPPPQDLIDKAKGDKFVVFFGAGVSRLVGYPTWQGWALKCLDKIWNYTQEKRLPVITYYQYERLKYFKPRQLLSICMSLCRTHKLSLHPVEVFQPDTAKCQHVYDFLVALKAIYVTTNY
ncbi:MAG: hypothetical protein WC421_11090 [Elusimicrobiales bacterium]